MPKKPNPTPTPTLSPTPNPNPNPDLNPDQVCAKDQFNDGCDVYLAKPHQCGYFDIPGFHSMEMCCARAGGRTPSPTQPQP